MVENKHINEVNEECTMSCFNYESFLYNILSTKNNYKNFLLLNYIGICMKKFDYFDFGGHINSKLPDEKLIHGLLRCSYTREYAKIKKINMVEEAMQMIEKGCYLYVYLDEFFMPNRDAYKMYHFIHDNLVYGYNKKEKIFYILGYKNSRQQTSLISFKDFEKSFEKLDPINELNSDIIFYKPGDTEYYYSCDYFSREIKEYMTSSSWLEMENCYYGLECYTGLIEYYSNLYTIEEIDIRIPFKLYEHKKILIERIEMFLSKNLEIKIIDTITILKAKILQSCKYLLIDSYKYNKERKNFKSEHFISIIHEIKNYEIKILNYI